MSDFKEDPSGWAESDEREIHPDAIVLRGQEAQEAGRAMLAWAGHVTAEQVEAAARAIYSSEALIERAARVLDVEGAFCGECDNELGGFYDECSQCRRFLTGYATAVVDAVVMPLVQVIERVRAALAGHPECDRYPNDGGEPILCGWKSAVVDVRAALEGAES